MSKGSTYNLNTPFLIKLALAILLVGFFGHAYHKKMSGQLDKVHISIKTGSDKKYLIKRKEVKAILDEQVGYSINSASVKDLDLFELERVLEADDRVSRAEMYLDKFNRLRIGVMQNYPIVRVEVTNEDDYYLDYNGDRIIKDDEIIRVPIVTGSVDKYASNYRSDKGNNLNYVLDLARKISEDEFLNSLVQQIHVTEDDDVILVPTLGRQRITLGPSNGLDDKMHLLKSYYQHGIKSVGMDRFKELDLRFDGQIVGIRKET